MSLAGYNLVIPDRVGDGFLGLKGRMRSAAPPLCEAVEKFIFSQSLHLVFLDTDNDL